MSRSSKRKASSGPTEECMNLKWDKNSEDAKFLRQLIVSGEVPQSITPKGLWEQFPDRFKKKYQLGIFRGGLNRLKTETGFHVRPDGQGDAAGANAGANAGGNVANVATAAAAAKKVDANIDHGGDSGVELLANDELVWRPVYYIAQWKDTSMTMRQTVILCLPSGVANGNTKNVKVSILDEGWTLFASVIWPKTMSTVEAIMKRWSEEERAKPNFVLRQMAMSTALSTMREHKNDNVESVARIPLEFAVNDKIEEVVPIGDSEGTRILLIDLKAMESSYEGVEEMSFSML